MKKKKNPEAMNVKKIGTLHYNNIYALLFALDSILTILFDNKKFIDKILNEMSSMVIILFYFLIIECLRSFSIHFENL